jgi:hypothetical protein
LMSSALTFLLVVLVVWKQVATAQGVKEGAAACTAAVPR